MPEAFAVLAVLIVALVAWFGAWTQARDPAQQNPREDFTQAQQEAAWLEERLELARREKWESHLQVSLNEKLAVTKMRARVLGDALAKV
ncbi:MAG: hypothetical protein ABIQ12_13225 [Opitutaceae bacterium]